MPNIKSAKKKMKQDIRREKENAQYSKAVRDVTKKIVKGDKSDDMVNKAYSAIDKAAKKNIIHKNKAARLKSKVTKLAKVA
jgi:small subunit ribosomal protein S20